MNSAPATKKDIDNVLDALKGFVQQTSDQFVEINGRFDKMDDRFDKFSFSVNARFDKIESEIVDLNKSHDRLLNTIDHYLSRLDRYETEQTARDSQFNRLLKWAKKVSKQTGIPLEDF
jgi:chromosome segregation ATPase